MSELAAKLSEAIKEIGDKPLHDFDTDRRQVVTWEGLLRAGLARAGFAEIGEDIFSVCLKVSIEMADARVKDVADRANAEIKAAQKLAETQINSMRNLMKDFTTQLRPFLEATQLQAGEEIVSIGIKQADGEMRIVSVAE